MSNSSSITHFLLLAFADTWELQLLSFWLFLGIYMAALMANGLIITVVACYQILHTPMYFFLLNLSLLDLGSISSIVPKAMANSLWDTRDISYAGCVAQVFLIVFFLSAEYSLLTVMAYDRYVAICQKLSSTSSPSLDLRLSVPYSVVPPAANPVIYSMRNQDLKGALKKLRQAGVSQQT
ncbi:olfactory receptor 14I1-like [Falco biarmicus]|uniref:olfactory receptor 14I1-like n=1 Tax=Falco biarmicus TaxID=345155 RepID=UPI0024BD2C2A|nr:olfactory receptor 14I1-like [Falco biarmicus]